MREQIEFFEAKFRYEIDAFDLFTALNAGAKIVVIDTRKREAYEAEHIPGALSLTHREMNEATTKDLDRDLLYVTYCQGIECNGSTKGALNMSILGFRVKELIAESPPGSSMSLLPKEHSVKKSSRSSARARPAEGVNYFV